jgi:hypothetical protein
MSKTYLRRSARLSFVSRAKCGLRRTLLRRRSLFARKREKRIAALLPAWRIRRWQVFALNPAIGITQHMPFDAFGIHDVFV